MSNFSQQEIIKVLMDMEMDGVTKVFELANGFPLPKPHLEEPPPAYYEEIEKFCDWYNDLKGLKFKPKL